MVRKLHSIREQMLGEKSSTARHCHYAAATSLHKRSETAHDLESKSILWLDKTKVFCFSSVGSSSMFAMCILLWIRLDKVSAKIFLVRCGNLNLVVLRVAISASLYCQWQSQLRYIASGNLNFVILRVEISASLFCEWQSQLCYVASGNLSFVRLYAYYQNFCRFFWEVWSNAQSFSRKFLRLLWQAWFCEIFKQLVTCYHRRSQGG